MRKLLRTCLAVIVLAVPAIAVAGNAEHASKNAGGFTAFRDTDFTYVARSGREVTARIAFDSSGMPHACFRAHPQGLDHPIRRVTRVEFGSDTFFCTVGGIIEMEKAAKEGRLKVVGDVLSRKKTLTKKNINLSKNDQGVLSGGFTNSRSGATTCGASMMSLESSIGALSAIRVGHTIGMPVFEAQQNATLFVGDSSRFKFQTVDSDGDAIDWGLFADVPQWLMDEYDANLVAGNSTPCDKLLVLLLRICGATGPAAGACVAAAITLYLACIAR